MKILLRNFIFLLREISILAVLLPYAIINRFKNKKIDIGLGPHPLINNIYHKRALKKQGYSVETFAFRAYHITSDFDILLSKEYDFSKPLQHFIAQVRLVFLPFRYKILYIYFNGGPFGMTKFFLWKIEPLIYKLAGIKTVVMAYGADVQEMTRCPNLDFKHAMTISYPNHKEKRHKIAKQIDIWTKYGDHVLGGCDWVDYIHHWDSLQISHFSIDTNINKIVKKTKKSKTFKILHAPNHRELKGTDFLIKAVDELKNEGLDIELIMLEKVPNEKVIELIQEVDVVADQFVIGWYAMFAIEAMNLGKPVMCYLREDLVNLYIGAGLIEKDEIPMINTHWSNVKDIIKKLYKERKKLSSIGKKSREYVEKHHSIEYIGKVFANINKQLIDK